MAAVAARLRRARAGPGRHCRTDERQGPGAYALRCGVRTSFKAMFTGKATQLLGDATPDDIIERLGAADDASIREDVSVHLYSFGGLLRTARWVSEIR